jgi:agmatine deiminase
MIPSPEKLHSSSHSKYRMPAEWDPHEATWVAWPHNSRDWPGKFATIPWVYGEIVRHLAPGELVRIIVESAAHRKSAERILRRAGVDLERVEFFRFRTDRGWTRDIGPMFVRSSEGTCAINNFRFTGWAKYANHRKDARIHTLAAKALGLPLLRPVIDGSPFVLEGGAIDVNGSGTLMTTRECLLDQHVQARNPGSDRLDLESALRNSLGVTNFIWLNRGIAGDDTHGHVDDLARFVDSKTIVMCSEENPRDANTAAMRENWELLAATVLEDGSRPDVVALPMPSPLMFNGLRLPASYANFYIANHAVLVPTFNDPRDRIALGILGDLFPDRSVIGIHAVDLVWGFGTLHCLTQQQPA